MSCYLHFRPDITVEELSTRKVTLASPVAKLSWSQPSNALYRCVKRLVEGKTESSLSEEWVEKGGESLAHFFYFFEQLKARGFICYSIMEKGRIVATLSTYKSDQVPSHYGQLDETESIQLSRFAYLRNKEGTFVLESPLVSARIHIKDSVCLELFQTLATCEKIDVIVSRIKNMPREMALGVLSLLQKGGFLSHGEETKSLQTWEFHDLLFHARNRLGRHDYPFGGTYPFLNKIDPYPVLGNFSPHPMIPLFKPDMNNLNKEDPSFTQVLENRESVREHGEKAISAKQLGEFLYRSARIKKQQKGVNYDISKRPSPGGGACHELELYPVMYKCEGIDSGLYHYHPEKHALDFCEVWNKQVQALAEDAMKSTNKNELPQVLIVIAARFGRVSWKYRSIAYSVILKNTGALIQTMYLVATAMGLAPCGVGGGNADKFSKITKTNYYEKTSVGEFILGARKN